MKLGILGGTFDPIHLGHIELAEKVLDKLCLDKILFIPAYISPHKKEEGAVRLQERLEMLQVALCVFDQFEISDVEYKRQDVSYTIDTVCALKEIYPDDELFLIIGYDQYKVLNSWKDYKKIQEYVKIAVVNRVGCEPIVHMQDENIIFTDITPQDVLATEIREKIRCGEDVSGLVPGDVWSYICMKGIYV